MLFVTPGFDPSAAIDIEVVLVDTDTLAESRAEAHLTS